jgi:DNA-binding GntR family transcriptional regulator
MTNAGKKLIPEIIRSRSLVDRVCEIIEEAIINHTFKPAEEIPEYKLAEDIGTSNTPVREALNRLVVDGLVVKETNKPPKVISLSKKDIEELYDIRIALEVLAIEKAALYINENDLEKMLEIQIQGEEFYRTNQMEQYKNYSRQFHNQLFKISRNTLLVKMMIPIEKKIRLCVYSSLYIPGRMRKGIDEHYKILELLKQKKSKAAAELMRKHIQQVKLELLRDYENVKFFETKISKLNL